MCFIMIKSSDVHSREHLNAQFIQTSNYQTLNNLII